MCKLVSARATAWAYGLAFLVWHTPQDEGIPAGLLMLPSEGTGQSCLPVGLAVPAQLVRQPSGTPTPPGATPRPAEQPALAVPSCPGRTGPGLLSEDSWTLGDTAPPGRDAPGFKPRPVEASAGPVSFLVPGNEELGQSPRAGGNPQRALLMMPYVCHLPPWGCRGGCVTA